VDRTASRPQYPAATRIRAVEWLALALILGTAAAGLIGVVYLAIWLIARALRG
jgi:uncharacterized membrane protein